MGFQYTGGVSGITVNGQDLSEFSAKLLTEHKLGACEIRTQTFQGSSRSTVLLLEQQAGMLEIRLPLEFWGESRGDTAEKWSRFCQAISGTVELELQDGFEYCCCTEDFGAPEWITDQWMSVEVTLRGMRHRPEVVLTMETALGETVNCLSTYPKTDCVVTLTVPAGTEETCVRLGALEWYLTKPVTKDAVLVLDGVSKRFLLDGKNITAQMTWEDFPYLIPGENSVAVFLDTIGMTRGVELRYRPTFL